MFIDSLEDRLVADGKCFFYRDIEISMPELSKHYILPAVILTKTGVIVFINTKEYGPLNKINSKCSNVVAFLRNKLELHYYDFTMFAIEQGKRYLKVNLKSNAAMEVDENYITNAVFQIVNNESATYDAAQYAILEKKMDSLNNKTSARRTVQTQIDEEGNEYVLRDGKWVQYIEEDPDEAFRNLLYFGLFGTRQFKEKKFFQGLFYLMSAGGFGAFWFMDCLQMLFGCRTVRGNKLFHATPDMIYRPIVDKKNAWIRFAAFLPVAVLLVFLYSKLMFWLYGTITPMIADLAESVVKQQVPEAFETTLPQ